jgi:hypothetical protein
LPDLSEIDAEDALKLVFRIHDAGDNARRLSPAYEICIPKKDIHTGYRASELGDRIFDYLREALGRA